MTDSAPIEFKVVGKTIHFPERASRLPGMSPDAVDHVLDLIDEFQVDPETVDMAKANASQARFAVKISTYSVAETLRRMDGARSIDDYLADLRADNDFETVAAAFNLVAERNEAVFGKKGDARPEEAPSGN